MIVSDGGVGLFFCIANFCWFVILKLSHVRTTSVAYCCLAAQKYVA
jgi:hypothetical protein